MELKKYSLRSIWMLGGMFLSFGLVSAQGLTEPSHSDWYFRDYAPKAVTPDYLQLPKLSIQSNRTAQADLPATMPVITPGSNGYLQVIPPDSSRKYYLRIEGASALSAPYTKE